MSPPVGYLQIKLSQFYFGVLYISYKWTFHVTIKFQRFLIDSKKNKRSDLIQCYNSLVYNLFKNIDIVRSSVIKNYWSSVYNNLIVKQKTKALLLL